MAQLASSRASYSGLTGKDMTWNAEGQSLQGSYRLCHQGRRVRSARGLSCLLNLYSPAAAAGRSPGSPAAVGTSVLSASHRGNPGEAAPAVRISAMEIHSFYLEKRFAPWNFSPIWISGLESWQHLRHHRAGLHHGVRHVHAKMLNFAHGDIIMIGGYVSFYPRHVLYEISPPSWQRCWQSLPARRWVSSLSGWPISPSAPRPLWPCSLAASSGVQLFPPELRSADLERAAAKTYPPVLCGGLCEAL